MTNSLLQSGAPIRGKLIRLALLFFALYCVILLLVFLSLRHVSSLLTPLVSKSINSIVQDVQSNRQLAELFSLEATLLSTFHGNATTTDAIGGKILASASTLEKLPLPQAGKELMAPLAEQLVQVVGLCEHVNQERKRAIQQMARLKAEFEEMDSQWALLRLGNRQREYSDHENYLNSIAFMLSAASEKLSTAQVQHSAVAGAPGYATVPEDRLLPATMEALANTLWLLPPPDESFEQHRTRLLRLTRAYVSQHEAWTQKRAALGRARQQSLTLQKRLIALMQTLDISVAQADKRTTQAIADIVFKYGAGVLLVLSLLLLIMGFATAWFLVTNITRPMVSLRQWIESIRGGNYTSEVRLGEENEWRDVEDALRSLASGLDYSFQAIEQNNLEMAERNRALRLAHEEFRSLFENAAEGIFQCTNTAMLTKVNPSMATILGYTASAELTDPPTSFGDTCFVDKEDFVTLLDMTNQKGKVSSFECRLKRNDGGTVWVYTSMRRVENDYGQLMHYEGSIMDITARMEAQERLERLNEELEERVLERTDMLLNANTALEDSLRTLNETQQHLVQSEKMAALGGLVAGVAHEINTPIGIGVTAASILDDQTSETLKLLTADQLKRSDLERYLITAQEASASILKNLNTAVELVQSFKAVAVDQTAGEKRRFNLKAYLDHVLLSLRPKYKRTSHTITVHCPEGLEIHADPGSFMQILTNLIVNSLIHAFGENDAGKITIDASERDSTLVLCYNDNGKGMPPEVKQRVFDPFFTTMRAKGGTGLGMHIVYNLVTQTMNGSIDCQSEPGEGTTFTIRLPKETSPELTNGQ